MFRSFLCAILLFSILLPAAVLASGGKFILPESELGEAAKVEVDSSNILIEAFSGKEQFRRLSPDSFAGVLGLPQKNIRWYPAVDPENLNRMMLRETSQSFDNSVVIFTESTGKKDGPNGSRLVFADTINMVVLKLIELPFYAYEIRCQGSSGKIWYLRKAQPDTLRDISGFGIYDVKNEEVVSEIEMKTLPKRLYPHITGRFAWILENGKICCLYPDGRKELYLGLKEEIKDFKPSPDCQFLAVFTEKQTKLYSADDKKLVYNINIVPDSTFVFLGGDPPSFLIGKNLSNFESLTWPETLYLVRKGQPRLIMSNLSGTVVADHSGRAFYSIKPKNHIEKRDSETGKYMSSASVTSLKPDTPGKPQLLFNAAEPGFFLIFDSVGGLNKIDATPRRWRKLGMMRPWTE